VIDLLQGLDLTTVVTTHNLSLARELGERTLVLSEDHWLIFDGSLDALLRDERKLLEVNLVHAHRHVHRHVHPTCTARSNTGMITSTIGIEPGRRPAARAAARPAEPRAGAQHPRPAGRAVRRRKGAESMAINEGAVRFTVSLPRDLLRELDGRIIQRGYHSRSEFVRDLIREKMVADQWSSDATAVVGVLAISYDHHERQLLQRLTDVQHDSRVNVLCTTHVHLEHDHCVEAIVIRGSATEIERLCIRIGGLRGVRTAGLTRTARVEL
jgi:CopG family nickel-responsive transcriptional regulator